MKRKGFSLIEITISIALTLTIVSAAYSLTTTALKIHSRFLAEKELTETSALMKSFLKIEFERASKVDEVLGLDGKTYTEIDRALIETVCIKLTRGKNTLYQRPYINQLIYLRDDNRYSLWSFKNSRESLAVHAQNYMGYSGAYEIGTYLKAMSISRIAQNIYNIELTLCHYQTGFEYKTNFYAKTQK